MSDEKPYDLEFVNNEIPQSPKKAHFGMTHYTFVKAALVSV